MSERQKNTASGRCAAAAIVALVQLASLCGGINDPPQSGGTVSSDWTVGAAANYSGVTIILDGNLTVAPTGTLVLDNVSLLVNCSYPGEHFIEVQPGGALRILNGSVIAGEDPQTANRYNFIVRKGGRLDMRNSEVRQCGDDATDIPRSGLMVESDLASFSNCTFSGNHCALVFVNCSSNVTDCTIRDCGIGIRASNSSVFVNNCVFSSNSGWGVRAEALSSVKFSNCTISGTPGEGNGTYADHSELHLDRCALRSLYQGVNGLFSTIGLDNSSIADCSDTPVFLVAGAYADCRNSSLDRDRARVYTGCWLNISWYVDIQGTLAGGGAAAGANATVRDQSGAQVASGSLDHDGVLRAICLRETSSTSNITINHTPHQLNVTSGPMWNYSVFCVTAGYVARAQLDNVAPLLWLDGPANGSLVNTSAVTLWGGASDAHSGLAYVEARVDTGEYLRAQGISRWNCSFILHDGLHQLDIRAFDQMANTALARVFLTVDTGMPVFSVNSPPNNTYTNQSMIWVRGIAELSSTVRVNGQTAAVNATDGAFDLAVTLAEGQNDLTVTVTDAALNAATEVLSIFLDTTAPAIVLTEPADGSYWNRSFVTVAGTTEPYSNVYIGNRVVRADDGHFQEVILLTEGPNWVNITVVDRAQNTNTRPLLLYLDRTRPFIELSPFFPFTRLPDITISGTTEPGADVWFNDALIGASGGAFASSVQLAPGANDIIIRSRDRAGNVNTTALKIQRDIVAPAIRVLSPADNDAFRGPSVLVSGTADDELSLSAVMYSTDQVSYFQCNGTDIWTIQLPLVPGLNRVSIRATDGAGNTNITVRTIIRDGKNPAATIEKPSGISPVRAGRVTVSGRASDEFGIKRVDISTDNRSWTPCAGTEVWTANITVSAGSPRIYVRVTDRAGNVGYGSANIVFEKDTQDPVGAVLLAVGVVFVLALLVYVWGASFAPAPGTKGSIRKTACPNCGTMIPVSSGKCPKCGIVFVGDEEE